MSARVAHKSLASLAAAGSSKAGGTLQLQSALRPSYRFASTSTTTSSSTNSLLRTSLHVGSRSRLSATCFGQQSRAYSLWPFGSSASKSAPVVNSDTAPSTATSDAKASAAASSQAAPAETAAAPDLATAAIPDASTSANAISSPSSTESVVDAVETGQHLLSDFGQGQTFFVGNIQKILVGVHDLTGLPWWASIPLTILTLRLFLLYPVGKLLAHSHRFTQVQPQISKLAEELKLANSRRDLMALQDVQGRMQALMAKHKVNPAKLLALPAIQAPLFIGLFFALKRLANVGWPDFKTGGLAWFTDLTVADPYYILPVISSLATLTTFELGADFGSQNKSAQTPQMRWGIRGVLLFSFAFMANLPAAVFVYWVTQNLLSLGQLFLIRLPFFRRAFNMPVLETSAKPATPASDALAPLSQQAPPQAQSQSQLGFVEGIRAGFDLGSGGSAPSSATSATATAASAPRATPAAAATATSSSWFSKGAEAKAPQQLSTQAAFQAKPARAGDLNKGKGKSKNKKR